MSRPLRPLVIATLACAIAGFASAQTSTTPAQEPDAPTARAAPAHRVAPTRSQSQSQSLSPSTSPPSTSQNRPQSQDLLATTSRLGPDARVERNVADAASPPHGPLAAASAAARATAQHNAKAEADADLAARQMGDHGHLKVDRENLTGPAAKATLLREGLGQPNYDHSIAMGDKDHVEQVTTLRVYVQKPATGQ